MKFIIENWYIILALIAAVAALVVAVVQFFKKSKDDQIAKVREWLLWAVTEAEKSLGGGTGRLKLRQVYDMFVERFSWTAKIISFEKFSEMVDDALAEMRCMLIDNEAVQAYVEG